MGGTERMNARSPQTKSPVFWGLDFAIGQCLGKAASFGGSLCGIGPNRKVGHNMQDIRYFILLALLGFATPSLSDSTPPASFEKWSDAGEWEILVDRTKKNGCLIQKLYPDGTLVRLGQLPAERGSYFAALNRDWTHIDESMSDQFYFDFGDELFAGEVVGMIEGDWHGGYAFFNNPEFIDEIGAKSEITIEGSRRVPLNISLKGTQSAIAELGRCQSAQAP